MPKRLFDIILLILMGLALTAQSALGQTGDELTPLEIDDWEQRMAYNGPVEASNRFPKELSKVPENITVLTSDYIEAINAHSVVEVLNRIPGVFLNSNMDIGSGALIHIQGSEAWHTKVLIDSVELNYLASGIAELHFIHPSIIDRIEVVKGSASSAWGSALGGVVNIVTKSGQEIGKRGLVSLSLGDRGTYDIRAEISDKGTFSYYANAGVLGSDGFVGSRNFESESAYMKLSYRLTPRTRLGYLFGLSNPRTGLGDFPSQNIRQDSEDQVFWAVATLDSILGKGFSLHFDIRYFLQETDFENNTLGLDGRPPENFLSESYDEKTTGASFKLAYTYWVDHTIVLGVELDRGTLDQKLDAYDFLQSIGAPSNYISKSHLNRFAVYLNDTIEIGRWAISPGIRLDYQSSINSFISPSLGITYRPVSFRDTVFRIAASRGFTTPSLIWTSGGGMFLEPNPDLDPEEVWSFQAGAETKALKCIWLKTHIFYHEMDNAIVVKLPVPMQTGGKRIVVNGGKVKRKGFDLEIETKQFYGFSLSTGCAYIDIDPKDEYGSSYNYSTDIAIRYIEDTYRVELHGHYLFRDLDKSWGEQDDFIWDLNINKELLWGNIKIDLFFTAHNLFENDQYWTNDYQNPGFWYEGGIRLYF